MKKLLLSVFALASFINVNAQCNELFISEYVEGTSFEKAIELYNPTNSAISLTGYRLERFRDGDATSILGGVLNLTGTIAAHSTFVITNNNTSPATSPALLAKANQLDNPYPAPTYMNGNDAIVLFKNTSIIDIFGMTGDAAITAAAGWSDAFPYDGSAGAIWTENHTLVRKSSVLQGVTVNPSPEFIVTAQWDSLPVNTISGLGAHTCGCPSGIDEIDNTVSVLVYPNPTNLEYVNVSSSEPIISAKVFNTLGQVVIIKEGNKTDKSMIIETAELPKGVYFVKASFDKGKSTVVKLSIQ